ncbi:MAG: HAMP domain-containing sensor histidine kinase, partial [Bacillota bacterium]|nr:HAMP domain-containing sensor histidine kinase [Bacillota bacterium]
LMAFLLSYFFAKKLAKPIVNITKSAKELGKGNYSVEFERSNYTEIDELAQVLNNTARELAKTDTLRRDLMANVSHDLRTPMTIIKSYAEMIRDLSGNIPEKRTAHTQVIIDESDRLQALVNDILDLSKLEAGTARITSEEFNISREVKEIVNRFHVFSETQGYTFTEDIDDDLFVFADEHTIAQVIYNLISNAVNYTGDDKKVEISLKRNGNKVKFSVKDTGDGIKPEEQELVWQRYYRASESHKRTKIGTGVGLSIVHNILENHKATYGIDSTYGEGSIFWFELPLIE